LDIEAPVFRSENIKRIEAEAFKMINRTLKSCAAQLGMAVIVWAIVLCAAKPAESHSASAKVAKPGRYYLPGPQASKIVTVTREGNAAAEVTVVTQPVAIKETGPKETIDHFGEVYTYAPSFIALHRGQPTMLTFWNLQPDDDHDFALMGPDLQVLMYVDVPPLSKTSYIFTFHREGLFDFKCLQHQPVMGGQILVLPPQG
jgi:plastocyanin